MYDITYGRNLKIKQTCMCKTVIDSQTQKTSFRLSNGRGEKAEGRGKLGVRD